MAVTQKLPAGHLVLGINEGRELAGLFTRRYLEEQLRLVLAGAAPQPTRPPLVSILYLVLMCFCACCRPRAAPRWLAQLSVLFKEPFQKLSDVDAPRGSQLPTCRTPRRLLNLTILGPFAPWPNLPALHSGFGSGMLKDVPLFFPYKSLLATWGRAKSRRAAVWGKEDEQRQLGRQASCQLF